MEDPRTARPLPKRAQPLSLTSARRGAVVPTGGMRARDRGHLLRQERTGTVLVLLVFYALSYGVTREPLMSVLYVGLLGLLMFGWPLRRSRRKEWQEKG